MIDLTDPDVVSAIAAFGDIAGLPVSLPCDIDDYSPDELAESPAGMAYEWDGDAS